jgi:hypothetical protein
MYTTALSPSVLAASIASIRLIKDNPCHTVIVVIAKTVCILLDSTDMNLIFLPPYSQLNLIEHFIELAQAAV